MAWLSKKLKFALCTFLVFGLAVVVFYAVPIIKGKYCYQKFIERVSINMQRDMVHKLANDIGYKRLDREIIGKGIVDNIKGTELDKTADVFYFRNAMIDSAVVIYYNRSGKVKKIVSD